MSEFQTQTQAQPQPPQQVHTVIAIPTKSVGISLLLTFFFGPFGMFYSTIIGALVMLVVDILAIFFTYGIGLLFTWPICMIWGAVAANSYNKRILRGQI